MCEGDRTAVVLLDEDWRTMYDVWDVDGVVVCDPVRHELERPLHLTHHAIERCNLDRRGRIKGALEVAGVPDNRTVS